ncbi:MAG: metallophosphoesterase [Eubacteriales bacterium]
MKLILYILILIIFAIFIFFLESYRERRGFEESHYIIKNKKLVNLKTDLKVVLLSDLHNKEYGNDNQKLIDAIQNLKPNIIFLAGDMLIGKTGEPTEIASKLIKSLTEIAPIYYGNGNHEQRMKDFPEKYHEIYQEYKSELVEKGVVFLENQSTVITIQGQKLRITGYEIPHEYYRHRSTKLLTVSEMHEAIGEQIGEYEILLAHNPAHAKTYQKWGADLVLSGHLHGGIVRIPFLGGSISPQIQLLPKYAGGHYTEKNTDIVVSRGLGEHTIKIRFLNKPELIVLHMKKYCGDMEK